MQQYLEHSLQVLTNKFSGYKPNRTGVDTISFFGPQTEYDLSEGFPLLTTKRMPFSMIVHELLWFLRGETNIKYMVDNNVPIWNDNAFLHYLKKIGREGKIVPYTKDWEDGKEEFVRKIKSDEEFARKHGNLNEIYGAQWIHWKTSDGKEINQIAQVLELIKRNPNSRRMLVSAWNPEKTPEMALPPCHSFFQIYTLDGKIDVKLYQRSEDVFLGGGFNIASYALLTHAFAKETGMEPRRFIHTFGDTHLYCGKGERGIFYKDNFGKLREDLREAKGEDFLAIKKDIEERAPAEMPYEEGLDHVTGILEQMPRKPKKLPRVKIKDKLFDKLTIDDFVLEDYVPEPTIKRRMAV